MACPSNSIIYNGTLCACLPGHVLDVVAKSCNLFDVNSNITTDSGVDFYALRLPETLPGFDTIKKFTQSQAVFMSLGDGRGVWFKLRWIDDQKVVTKRKTELGGAFSIASWILFIGLFAALLYQIISKRSIEVHNVRATSSPELTSFLNDMEFNITTVSSMSCANLRALGNLVTGNPGFLDERVVSLSTLANYSCHNSSKGPTIAIKCKGCKLISDNMYISWQFVDLPNNPATAVGYEFNLAATDSAKKHLSFVNGTLKNGSAFDDKPVTFRGRQSNILKFNLFPRIYRNLHDLKLIQPLFHEFLPGSVFRDTNQLRTSLENSVDGLVNTTLYINFLSAYVVEVDKESILGPVSFLADLGGLYCISIGIFFYLLIQCEYRVKKLRNEGSVLRSIRNRRKAQDNWDKLRKYVKFTYGFPTMDVNNYDKSKTGSCCDGFMLHSIHGSGSSRKQRQKSKPSSINLYKKTSLPVNKSLSSIPLQSMNDSNMEKSVGSSRDFPPSQSQESCIIDDNFIPPPPSLECKGGSEMDMADIQKNLKNLYEYNMMLRDRLLAAQSSLQSSSSNHSSQIKNNGT
ncbi:hypothetical protein TSUD_181710 [Trifolium subterraneum]|uniref:Uncharacterized protein n=1 Tax=Trifolium subterraneum TaxID=3900 RepID=A0A2Z6NS87_TRISU|nr:hypothetical protein TSUD_181710 [Trifolium subterraneum]